jgi:hypothetical protein
MLLGTLATSYQALASLPFLVHRFTVLPRLANSLRQRNLRQLTSRCVHHPGSQVDIIRMKQGIAERFKVVIVLEMTGFL